MPFVGRLLQLETRLAEKEEQLLEKDLIFEQVQRLVERIRNKAQAGKDDTLTLAKRVRARGEGSPHPGNKYGNNDDRQGWECSEDNAFRQVWLPTEHAHPARQFLFCFVVFWSGRSDVAILSGK